MDPLSHLLSLYPVRTALDVRCRFGAPWELDNVGVEFGVAPYHVIAAGGGRLEMRGREDILLRPGDIILFPKGTAHRLHAQETADAPAANLVATGDNVLPLVYNEGSGPVTEILCGEIVFATGASKSMLAALPDLIHVRTEGRTDLATLQNLIGLLRVEVATVRPGASAVVAQLASALFALLMRAWMEQGPSVPGLFAFLAEPRLRPALGRMLTEPARPWQLGELAAVCNMSRATFARLVNKVGGATPAAFLAQTRMARAAALLAEGQLSVGQVGEQVGYQSEAAFNRAFRRSYGVGPGAYRRNGATAAPDPKSARPSQLLARAPRPFADPVI